MNHTLTPRQIAGGYALAGLTLCLGVFLSLRVGPAPIPGGDVATLYLRTFYFLALGIVFLCTAAWGRRRGFDLRRKDGAIDFSNLLRVLVMSVIMWGVVVLTFAPIVMGIFQLSR